MRLRSATTAVVLWLVFAAVVWNVIFDRIVVLAGRRYAHDAATLYRSTHQYLLLDDVMRPAISHGVLVATLAAGAVVLAGLAAIRAAAALDARREAATRGR
jgi:uncharacterized membrane protein